MGQPHSSSQRQWPHLMVGLMLSLLSFFFTLCAGEMAFRCYQRVRWGIPLRAEVIRPSPSFPVVLDAQRGWRAVENFHSVTTQKSVDGSTYTRTLSQNEYGFRMFGEVHTQRMKVLVIGDSVTHALEASDDKTYYAVMKDALNVEVFAYGVIGYGTLQEYLVLDRYLDDIKPDLILWQFCSNDFVNNSVELEEQSTWENSGTVRPYLIDGQIRYVLARKGATLRQFAQQHSRLLHVIFGRLDTLTTSPQTIETHIEQFGMKHEGFLRSLRVTEALMGKVKSRAGKIPIGAFSADEKQPYLEAFQALSTQHGMHFLGSVRPALRAAEQGGSVVLAADGNHWNEAGHRVVGETLAAALRTSGTLR